MDQRPAQATFLHADLDAFYASVEQLLDPDLRGRPVAVGGGVVLAASYEARRFGVRGGMPIGQARARCPRLLVVGGHFREYQRLADQVIDVLHDVTPLVERISIDEAFLDVGGALHLFGSPGEIAHRIRSRVRAEVGLAISVGAATTKHLAKVASQVAKPDGVVVVEPGGERAFLEPLPVGLLWGVGPVTEARLAAFGVTTVGQLADLPGTSLERLLGRAVGAKLAERAANLDPRRVEVGPRARSVGAQHALGRRPATPELVRTVLRTLADRVAARLRTSGRAGRTVTVRVRFPDLSAVTRSSTLPAAIATTSALTEVGVDLVGVALADQRGPMEITLLAISVSKLVHQPALQLELPLRLGGDHLRPGTEVGAAHWAADRAVDTVRDRFGRRAVGYAAVALADLGGVPDEFRELAERDGTTPGAAAGQRRYRAP